MLVYVGLFSSTKCFICVGNIPTINIYRLLNIYLLVEVLCTTFVISLTKTPLWLRKKDTDLLFVSEGLKGSMDTTVP